MQEKSQIIAKYDSRREQVFRELKLPGDSENVYRYAAMELMITTESDEQFKAILEQFVNSTNGLN